MISKHVTDLHSISKATKKMCCVQSNISKRMKILEDELDVRLLIRRHRGVRLMKEGITLCEYVEGILKLMQDAESVINNKEMERKLYHWCNIDCIGSDSSKNLFALLGRER